MTKDEVLTALNKLGIPARCPLCDTNSWGGVGYEGQEVPLALELADQSGQYKGATWECAAIACNNCGYVRLFHEAALRQHL